MKIQFGVTAMLHATGEADIDESNQSIFIHPVQISPVLVCFTPTPLTEDDLNVLRVMAIHQLVKLALTKVTPDKGVAEESSVEINMSPQSGEKN